MSSIHILVPTPSFPPTEEYDDHDEQAAPLALTWCCVYIVSILEKKTFSPSPSLSLCVSQFPSLPHSLSLTPPLPPSPKHPKPSLPSSPKSYRIQVVYIIEADQMYAMFLCCSCCLFLCVLLVNENIRCSKTSERNGYLGKNEGEIKRKEKKRRKKKKKIPSRPVPSEWYGQ